MSERPRNAFLRSLGQESYALFSEHLSPIRMELGRMAYEVDGPVDWVYFPETALLSVVQTSEDGRGVETAAVGSEGGLLLLEACASGLSTTTCFTQIDGHAWRAPAAACRALMLSNEDFARCALRLFEMQAIESRQSGMCQALHSVEPRFARWLLECAERAGGRNPMPLTQEFIGAMLGIQRTTVTAFAGQMQKIGLISYTRGRVELLDLEGLEERACECRDVTREQRRRLGLEPVKSQGPDLRLVSS
jgi:CRP-like cAMP-binding protein